ncbi:prolyl oligopeptidase family serine peptidase [Mucilaginibacter sp. Bleaf8]|uniref:alpha/beta hydrolase n=1 Tax=Mucilaginibacter sp. Bleaf8 TaxID=2834430 RepID=UPI001BD1A029|nr:prolyl oligopeptidase family serine peptidase [Mucilaginibacter sp. Bleaf8]MBS7563242.1 prolyl oligopeptidase family serine peptidase [Mucilaginibacter sp. Bleaf8]
MYTHQKQIFKAGKPAHEAKATLILIHGRGGTAQNILSLAQELNAGDMALYAPQASNQSWYPYSFMAPDVQNQPALDSALQTIKETVDEAIADGIAAEQIYFAGFSQGACLTLEFIARHAQRYAGAVAFTGGLIGKQLDMSRYNGNLSGTPLLITTGDPDAHVPLSRVEESVAALQAQGAEVTLKVYAGRPHTITYDEIKLANELIFVKQANL